MNYREELRKKIDLFPLGFPDSFETNKILELLFSDEDARIAAALMLPPAMLSPDRVAKKSGLPRRRVAERLSWMAGRALIAEADILGRKSYALLPSVPGFIEMQFMSGQETDDVRREVGKLWHQAAGGEMGKEHFGYGTCGVRVVPIKKTIDVTQNKFSFEELEKIIGSSGTISLADCACRKSAGHCSAPMEVCVMFGLTAEYLVGRGLARKVGAKEALLAMESCADAGLIATSTNVMPPINVICNCCRCCCASLRGQIAQNGDATGMRSNFCSVLARESDCTLCKMCVKACPVEAITVVEERITVDETKCLGCGVCAHKCNRDALALTRKSKARPPQTPLHLLAKLYEERDKGERIMRAIADEIF